MAKLIKESRKTGTPIRQLVLDRELLDEGQLDEALDVLRLTKGGITKK